MTIYVSFVGVKYEYGLNKKRGESRIKASEMSFKPQTLACAKWDHHKNQNKKYNTMNQDVFKLLHLKCPYEITFTNTKITGVNTQNKIFHIQNPKSAFVLPTKWQNH